MGTGTGQSAPPKSRAPRAAGASCKADSRGRTGFEQGSFPQAKVLTEIVEAAKDFRLTVEERGNLKGPAIGDALNNKRATVVKAIREKYADELATSL